VDEKSFDKIETVFVGTAVADDDFNQDEWGIYISGYAPIFAESGTVVGVVGVDIRADVIKQMLRRLGRFNEIFIWTYFLYRMSFMFYILFLM